MANQLATTISSRIADLSPSLSDLSTRSIRAVVTLIWPYSSSSSTLTVLLAEPDFRLRKAKGQVRVRFSGSSARTVFESGIGSGDEVILSLDGVEWLKDGSVSHTPGCSVEWELKYVERLLLQLQESGTNKITLLDIDHPEPQIQTELLDNPSPAEGPSSPPKAIAPTSRPGLKRLESSEWDSPAFVKRARISYGSLFESGYDIFADDGTAVSGKGSKRNLFSRGSNSWRYNSRSESPEVDASDEGVAKTTLLEDDGYKPIMTDEGCQTIGLDVDYDSEPLATLPVVEANALSSELIDNTRMNGEVVDSLDASWGLVGKAASAQPLLVAGFGVTHESDNQEGREDEMEGCNRSPLHHSGSLNTPPIESSILPSTPKSTLALGLFHEHEVGASFTVGERPDEREQSSPFSRDMHEPHDINEVQDLYGLSPVAHSHIESFAEELEPAHISVTQNDSHAPVQPVYPDPEAGLNSENYPRSPYYEEEKEAYLGTVQKLSYSSDIVTDTANHEDDDQPDPGTGRLSSATAMPAHKEKRTSSSQSSSILRTKALPNPEGVMMSRSQSAQSDVIDLTEDSDVEDSESEVQDYAHREIDERHYREGQMQTDENADEDDEDVGEDEEDEEEYEHRRYMNEHDIEEDAPGDQDHVGLTYSPGFRSEEYTTDEEMDDYDGDVNGQEKEYFDDDQSAYESSDSPTGEQRLKGEPEVIDLLSSDDDEAVEANESNLPSAGIEGHGSAITRPTFGQGENTTNQDAYDEVEEENFEQDVLLNVFELDVREHEPDSHIRGGPEQEEPETSDLGEQFMAETERPSAEVAAGVEDFGYEPLQQEKPLTIPGGFDGAHDSTIQERPRIFDGQEATPSEPLQIESVCGETKYAILPAGHKTENGMADLEAKTPQDDKFMREGYALETENFLGQDSMEDDALSPNDDGFVLDKNVMEGDQAKFMTNGQLPTPDATQITIIGAAERLFDPACESEPTRESQSPSSEPLVDTQASPIQETIRIRNIPTADTTMEGTAVQNNGLGSTLLSMLAGDPQDKSSEYTDQVESNGDPNGTNETLEQQPSTPQRLEPPVRISEQDSARTEKSPIMLIESLAHEMETSAPVALGSPSKGEKEPDAHVLSEIGLRVILSRPLHTPLGDFTTLKVVRYNLEKKIDVLAIVVSIPTEPIRAKNGPRHFHLHFKIIDASITPASVLSVHIFRPFKVALPIVKPGDGVLLRSFIVKAEPKSGFGLRSDDSSSWAVFKDNREEEVRGPPVEFGDEEREHIVRLKDWYYALDPKSKERLERATVDNEKDKGAKGKGKGT